MHFLWFFYNGGRHAFMSVDDRLGLYFLQPDLCAVLCELDEREHKT